MRIRKTAQNRKTEIEQTALMLAFKLGPSQVTTGMIANELGLTQPAIYRHYPKKDDIWAAIATQLSDKIKRNIAEATDPNISPLERLRKLVLEHLKLVQQYPALPEFMVIRNRKNDRAVVQNNIQVAITALRAALETEVMAAVADSTFRKTLDPVDAAALIFGVIQSLVLRMLVTRNPAILAKDGARLLDLQLAGFS